jgi:hypothetical protein
MSAKEDSDRGRRVCPRRSRLADVNAEMEEFTVDARSAPNRVLAAHLPDQFRDFLRHRWPADLAAADLPSPIHWESFEVPKISRFPD